ncbi:MAG: allophanate hydrolase subunit 1 [Comamonadaceae bacterium]|nr:MAG: allophanate hydrolase subunit 1 [Comamonadaceae bacterium]
MTRPTPGSFEVRPAGENGLLLDLPSQESVHRMTRWLLEGEHSELFDDVVPGGRTVLIIPRHQASDVTAVLQKLELSGEVESRKPNVLEIHVSYTGPDLDEVCAQSGVERAEFIEMHSAAQHTVAFFGFTPGFFYLSGVPEPLQVPRRATPRLRIPAGSVAVANGYTVIYPGETPGGWNIIGHADCPPLWDIAHDPPNLVGIGDRIVFREQS